MSSSASPERHLPHRRTLDAQVYGCDDGLFDAQAQRLDLQHRDPPSASGPRKIGEPPHDMRLSLIVDPDVDALDAAFHADRVPGTAVQTHHPRWFRGASAASAASS